MITEDYVSFEIAKLLKEKGFDVFGDGSYGSETKVYCEYSPFGTLKDCSTSRPSKNGYPAPTLQMAMKWLREVHHYIIEIHYGNVGSPIEPEIQWWWELENKQGEFLEGNITDGNTTYEEAVEAACLYVLKNLI